MRRKRKTNSIQCNEDSEPRVLCAVQCVNVDVVEFCTINHSASTIKPSHIWHMFGMLDEWTTYRDNYSISSYTTITMIESIFGFSLKHVNCVVYLILFLSEMLHDFEMSTDFESISFKRVLSSPLSWMHILHILRNRKYAISLVNHLSTYFE